MNNTISLRPVASSQLSGIGYDSKNNILAIEFHGGAVYHYQNVTQEDWEALEKAESKGSHFYKKIKPPSKTFPYVKMKDGAPKEKAQS